MKIGDFLFFLFKKLKPYGFSTNQKSDADLFNERA